MIENKKYFIKTQGCQMNVYDSDKISDLLVHHYSITRTEDPNNADILILNTCSIREKAQEKVFSQLGRWRQLKEKNPYTDEYGAWIITGSGESDYFYTTDNGQQGVSGISSVPDVISVGATELSNGTITSFSQRDDELLNVFAPHVA